MPITHCIWEMSQFREDFKRFSIFSHFRSYWVQHWHQILPSYIGSIVPKKKHSHQYRSQQSHNQQKTCPFPTIESIISYSPTHSFLLWIQLVRWEIQIFLEQYSISNPKPRKDCGNPLIDPPECSKVCKRQNQSTLYDLH